MVKKNKSKKQKKGSKKNNKIISNVQKQLIWITYTALLMVIGLILFKYIPMHLFGKDILFDASQHIIVIILALYIFWFFIDQKKSWKIPYFIFAGALIIIVGIQRMIANQHNEVGIMLALIIGALSIIIPRWKEFMAEVKF